MGKASFVSKNVAKLTMRGLRLAGHEVSLKKTKPRITKHKIGKKTIKIKSQDNWLITYSKKKKPISKAKKYWK